MDQFDKDLEYLGWAKQDFAACLGLHRNTVSRWKKPPGYARVYLDLRIGITKVIDREMERILERGGC